MLCPKDPCDIYTYIIVNYSWSVLKLRKFTSALSGLSATIEQANRKMEWICFINIITLRFYWNHGTFTMTLVMIKWIAKLNWEFQLQIRSKPKRTQVWVTSDIGTKIPLQSMFDSAQEITYLHHVSFNPLLLVRSALDLLHYSVNECLLLSSRTSPVASSVR